MLTLDQVLEDQKDLKKLCSDTPSRPLITKEIFHPNAFYGNDLIYKEYAGLHRDYPLKIVFPHGPDVYGGNKVWTAELNTPLPVIAAYSDAQYKKYAEAIEKTRIKKRIFNFASPFLYLLELIKLKGLQYPDKERKGTIFFPTHSTHHIKANINSDLIAETLANLDGEYHPVTVCLYWKDYNLGRYAPYLKKGLQVVSAGHIYDPNFLFRFYHLCSLHHYSAGNSVGSYIPFSIKSGCSYFHLDIGKYKLSELYDFKSDPAQFIEVSRHRNLLSSNDCNLLFRDKCYPPTPEQIAIADKYLGIEYIKSPETLKHQIMEAESLYQKTQKQTKNIYPSQQKKRQIDYLLSEIVDNLNSYNNKEVLQLFDKLITLNPSLIGIIYAKAVALARLSRYEESIKFLSCLISKNPKHEKAVNLMNEIQIHTNFLNRMLNSCKEFIIKEDINYAFKVLNSMKSLKNPVQNIDLLRAHCFLRMNQIPSAKQALEEELRYFPSNTEAKKLLDDITTKYKLSKPKKGFDPEFLDLLQQVRPYTMLSEERLFSLFSLTKQLCLKDIAGNFAECGVAAGGSTALMAATIKKYSKRSRLLYAFDSFEGMPMPTEHDKHGGIRAEETGWGSGGTCAAPEDSVKSICHQLGVLDIVKPVKGYFEETLPQMQNEVGPLAFLHMDGDWYESTMAILDNLYDQIVEGGIIQVDDYGFWEGCRKAIQEFAQKNNLRFQMNKIDSTGVWCYKPTVYIGKKDRVEDTKPSVEDGDTHSNGNNIFIVSYPRSGNTWLRTLLADIILQKNDYKTNTKLPIHQDKIIPDLDRDGLVEIDDEVELSYRLYKTHKPSLDQSGKIIYIFRNPADALTSHYHFHLRYAHLRDKVKDGLDTFCLNNIESWIDHLNRCVQQKLKSKHNLLFFSYEMMHENLLNVLLNTLNFLGISESKDREMCRIAIENHAFL